MSRPKRKGRPTPRWVESEQRYVGQISNGTDPATGKRRRITVSDRDYDRCMDKIVEVENALRDGSRRAPSRETFAGVARLYLETNTELREKTALGYLSHLENYLLPEFGHRKVSSIEPIDITAFWGKLHRNPGVRGKPLSKGTLKSIGRTLSAVLSFAVANRLLTSNPFRPPKVSGDSKPSTIKPPREEDVAALFRNAAGSPRFLRHVMGFYFGLRQGEVLALTYADITLSPDSATGNIAVRQSVYRGRWKHGCGDVDACNVSRCKGTGKKCQGKGVCGGHASTCPKKHGGGLRVGKVKTGHGERDLPIVGEALAAFLEHRSVARAQALASPGRTWSEGNPLFPGLDGGWLCPRQDWGIFQDELAAANVPHCRLHDARHYATSELLSAGIDRATILRMMGWGNQSPMLGRYGHSNDDLALGASLRMEQIRRERRTRGDQAIG